MIALFCKQTALYSMTPEYVLYSHDSDPTPDKTLQKRRTPVCYARLIQINCSKRTLYTHFASAVRDVHAWSVHCFKTMRFFLDPFSLRGIHLTTVISGSEVINRVICTMSSVSAHVIREGGPRSGFYGPAIEELVLANCSKCK